MTKLPFSQKGSAMRRSLFTIIVILLLSQSVLAKLPDPFYDHFRLDYFTADAKAQDRRILVTAQTDFLQGIAAQAFCDGREFGLLAGPHIDDEWIDRIEVLLGASIGRVANAGGDTIKVSYLNAEINWWAHVFPFNMDWRSHNAFASGQHGNGNYALSDNSFSFGQAPLGIRSYNIVEGLSGASPKHWGKWRLYVGPQLVLPKLGGITLQAAAMMNAQTPGDFLAIASLRY